MPAKSKSQRKLFGIAKAVQKGDISPDDVSGAAKDIAKNVSPSDIDKFAKTKEAGLPDKVEEKLREYIKKIIGEILKETEQISESSDGFTDEMRIRNKKTGEEGTITVSDSSSIRVVWDDYKNTMRKAGQTPSSMTYDINKAKELFEPIIDEYAGINVLPANGQITMGTKGDASFFGPDAKMKGGVKRSVYKVPKSSIHGEKDESDDDNNVTPAFYDDEKKKKKSFVDTGSVPKTSIHNSKFNETAGFPATNPGGGVGDASFIGKNGMYKGNSRKPIYKTPKSSIYYKKGRFPGEADFHNDDNWETDSSYPSPRIAGEKPYVADRSVPKDSIHNQDFEDDEKNEDFGIPISADGVIDGGPRSMDPVVGKKTKKKKFADASKYGYPKESINEESQWWDKSFEELDKLTTNRLLNILKKARIAVLYRQSHTDDYSEDEIENAVKYYKNIKLILSDRGHVPRKSDDIKTEEKDYDTNIVPKTSIHYGERDKVKGQPKMKFEKRITKEAGFVPDEIKNLKTQGDWKNNLTKAVMDLTGEAQPQEPSIPVPIVPIGDTPEFPFANEEDGTMVYPIPGEGGTAIKNGNEWTFGDTPQLPAAAQELGAQGLESPGCMAPGEPTDSSEIDIPCSKKPLIKKLMMFIKNEQKNLHEGIALQGLYEGKVVKLNTIFEGEHRRFKAFVKTNESKIMKVHFGPTLNEDCGKMSKKKVNKESDENRLSTEGITKRGSQVREPIGDTDYEVVSKTEDEVILKDKETGKKEVWVENDDFAGYVIEIGGRGYEFTHGVNEGHGKKVNEDNYKKYVVEPRNDDGSLNVKRDYNPDEPKSFITGATEDEIYDYFFANNNDNPKFQHSAGWKDIVTWYKEQGLTIREKTW